MKKNQKLLYMFGYALHAFLKFSKIFLIEIKGLLCLSSLSLKIFTKGHTLA